ncbi:hypothetical protein RFI_27156 [Reticulomyxa filosa]|uniref:Uncharacterized protein n=1 Tax=Reticulomyxa filosa TaxID=46433 RepID=X6MB06_RETFI|nr:hypothetical protein RFI_27156 [Reticulomyxa filosa]|eukprot:ETO10220.1 hypothetical protein RFI_27156 [Reticulomyxa filosa]
MSSHPWNIYTIGHSNYPVSKFVDVLKEHKIATVVDIRAAPFSRNAPDYGIKSLQSLCGQNQINYEWKGDLLGGKHKYQQLMKKLRNESECKLLIESIFKSIKHPCVLLCSEWNVNNCHRKDISDALLQWGICKSVQHLWLSSDHSNAFCKEHQVAINELPKDKEKTHDQSKKKQVNPLYMTPNHRFELSNFFFFFRKFFNIFQGFFFFFLQRVVPWKISRDDLLVKSAACLIPDESLWGPIQEIRKKYDKSYHRWMPHINFLYPFVSPDLFEWHTKEFITEKLKNIKPFEIEFSEFSYFDQQPSEKVPDPDVYVFLLPKESPQNSVQHLYDTLIALYPICHSKKNKDQFHAHLTVGQFKRSEVRKWVDEFNKSWKKVSWKVTHLSLISRPDFDTPFDVKIKIPLGDQ